MRVSFFSSLFSFSAACAISVATPFITSAYAHEYQLGALHIDHPYARATVPGQTTGAVYLTIDNKSKQKDWLTAISTPAAKTVEVHTMTMDGNLMKMRAVERLELAPLAKVEMKPGGGYHLMLLNLRQPLKAGEMVPMTLTFAKAGKVDVSIKVEERTSISTSTSTVDHSQGGHNH